MQLLKFVKKVVPPFVTGTVATPVGPVPVVSSVWSRADQWGMIKSRSSAFRMAYTVEPGLYAVGAPDKDSEVLVTANYKLTFDIVRRAVAGLSVWVLVLDTKSINVWCAAGKGTFGTEELINRMSVVQLEKVVQHRRIILPQLGAVGVASGEVQKRTGFRVHFGPCEARDIPAYLKAGRKKTKAMSIMPFRMIDRLVLTPMEINPAMKKYYPWFAAAVLVIFGLQPTGILFADAWSGGWPFLLLGLITVLAGAFLTPVLLPYVPFRSFALKGWVMGMAATMASLALVGPGSGLLTAVSLLLFPALSSYIALQFTGSTTFTGMSGVKKELKIGIPLYATAAGVSLVLLVLFKLKEWEVL